MAPLEESEVVQAEQNISSCSSDDKHTQKPIQRQDSINVASKPGDQSKEAPEAQKDNGPPPLPEEEKVDYVQAILDRNKLLINEIKANHEARTVKALQRNVALIKELNSNTARVVDAYQDVSHVFLSVTGENP
mmetsp:Transcript_12170/g.44418  ORF Transcript_12170/g.44418 Transcript_12170/m.44418 type:complete len:133 (-) Transcript_12170:104-502(-)